MVKEIYLSDLDDVKYNTKDKVTEAANALLVAAIKPEVLGNFRFTPEMHNHYYYLRDETLKRFANQPGIEEIAKKVINLWFDTKVLGSVTPYRFSTVLDLVLRTLNLEEWDHTSRLPHLEYVTRATLWKYSPEIIGGSRESRLLIKKEGDTRSSEEFKMANVLDLRPLVVVEDHAETARYIKDRLSGLPRTRLLVRNQPWNQDRGLDKYRVHGTLGIAVGVMQVRAGLR